MGGRGCGLSLARPVAFARLRFTQGHPDQANARGYLTDGGDDFAVASRRAHRPVVGQSRPRRAPAVSGTHGAGTYSRRLAYRSVRRRQRRAASHHHAGGRAHRSRERFLHGTGRRRSRRRSGTSTARTAFRWTARSRCPGVCAGATCTCSSSTRASGRRTRISRASTPRVTPVLPARAAGETTTGPAREKKRPNKIASGSARISSGARGGTPRRPPAPPPRLLLLLRLLPPPGTRIPAGTARTSPARPRVS